MGDFSVNLLNTNTDPEIWLQVLLVLTLYNQQDWQKTQKALIDNILRNSIKFSTFPGNITDIEAFPLFLILKNFHCKSLTGNSDAFEQNYHYFNDHKFKNDLKVIPWNNILSQNNLAASLVFELTLQKLVLC